MYGLCGIILPDCFAKVIRCIANVYYILLVNIDCIVTFFFGDW
jgi:hypothetical protein